MPFPFPISSSHWEGILMIGKNKSVSKWCAIFLESTKSAMLYLKVHNFWKSPMSIPLCLKN